MPRQNDKSLLEVLKNIVGNHGRLSNGYLKIEIEKIWKEVMGSVVAGYTSKITLYDGQLKIYVTSSALRAQLNTEKQKIVSVLNDRLSYDAITDVKIY